MNFAELIFQGWAEANHVHPVSIFEKVLGNTIFKNHIDEDDLSAIKKQDEFLANYYFRQAKQAEAEHFSEVEFFDSCNAVIRDVKNKLFKKYIDQIDEQRTIKEAAQNERIKYTDDNGLPYEQRIKETIESCNQELQKIKVTDFSHPLIYETNGKVTGHIRTDQLERITTALKSAQQRCIDSKSKTADEPASNKYLGLFKTGGLDLFDYLWQNISEIKEKTRANVLFHGVRNECFTSNATHKTYKEFLKKEYNVNTSKITKPNHRGQDFIKQTLPRMVKDYQTNKKEMLG